MSDNPVSNVSRVDFSPAQLPQVTQQVNQPAQSPSAPQNVQPAAPKTAEAPKAVEASRKEAAKEAASQQQVQKAQVPLISRETNLKFQVDDKTHQVTIMIMDRATNKVITTIPPDKIKDVPPGDLLQYMI